MNDRTLPPGHTAPPPPSQNDRETSRAAEDAGSAERYQGLAEPRDFLAARPAWLAYLLTVTLTALTIALRKSLDLFGEHIAPFSVFYPVVLLSTLFGGIGPGIVALAMSTLAASYFWLEPRGSVMLGPLQLVNASLFVAANAVNIYLAHRLRTAHASLRKSEARLALSQDVGRIGIWDLDLRTGALWWSPSLYAVTGIAPDTPPSVEAFFERVDAGDLDRARTAFEAARRGDDRLDIEFRFHRDDGLTIWLAARAELFRDGQGRPTRLLGINFDATPIRTAETERDRANSLLETFFESLPGAAFAKDREGRYLLGNPIFAAAVGRDDDDFIGRDDLEVLRDEDQARIIMANDRAVMAGGVTRQIEEALLLPNGEMSHWLAVKAPFFDAAGQPQGIMGISLDVTDRKRAEERLRFLADEVDHRAKNLLGVVLSLVRLTKVEDVSAFKAAVSGRIEALARAHTLLAANRWQGIDIATLLREEIAPFGPVGGERIRVDGPPLMLEPNAAQALAMAVHELAINAAMYGALSAEEGRLGVAWEISEAPEGGALVIEWRESGGPPVTPPARPGFGSTAIRGAIEHQLGGTFALDWAREGVRCRIAFPLGASRAGDAAPRAQSGAASPAPQSDPGAGVSLAGKRVLIVEDEALIALTVMDMVRELGCAVVGPASTVAAALDLARARPPDLAVLDVNLAGVGSGRVAEALRALGVPFVYCTGYAEPALQIDPALAAPMLTKPIDPQALAAALRGAVAGRAEPAGHEPIGA